MPNSDILVGSIGQVIFKSKLKYAYEQEGLHTEKTIQLNFAVVIARESGSSLSISTSRTGT